MSTKFIRTFSFLSTLLLGACDLAGDDDSQSVREIVTETSVTLPKAIEIAVASLPAGVMVEAELEVENTTPVFEVRILDAGMLTRIHVHPDTGMVLGKEQDSDADDVAEATAAAEVLAGASIDAAAAIATAEAQRPGSVAFEFEVKRGLIEVEVAAEAGLFEISIDPATGAVVEVETSDDDHSSDDDSDDDHGGGNDDTAGDSPDDNGGDNGGSDDTAGDSPDDNGQDTAGDSPDDNGQDTAGDSPDDNGGPDETEDETEVEVEHDTAGHHGGEDDETDGDETDGDETDGDDTGDDTQG